tara:strand:- start:1959 stop:2282 length:324 start_codon:yes stop_codon:yes gene_type:complete
MAEVKILPLIEAPAEGTGKMIQIEHPITAWEIKLAVFQVKGKFYAIENECRRCSGNLGLGTLNGMYVSCPKDDTPWNVRNGLCKFDRTQSVSSFRVHVTDDTLITNL